MLKKISYIAIVFVIFNIFSSANYAMFQEDIEENGYNKNILLLKSNIEKSFLDFVQSEARSPVNTLHIIQAEDFDTGQYRFHYSHQELYRLNVKSQNYPKYKPIGSIKIIETSPAAQDFLLIAEWLLEDNPSPGINTAFQMSFCVYPQIISSIKPPMNDSIDLEPSILNPEHSESLRKSEIEADIFGPYSPEKALNFVKNLGYDGDTFCLKTFSSGFCNRYLGFTKDEPGFNLQTATPVVHDIEAFSLTEYLDISNEHFIVLNPCFVAPVSDPTQWLAARVKDIYDSLQKKHSFHRIRDDAAVRHPLTIKDRELHLEMNIADEIDNKIYAISPNNHFYIEGKDCGNHPNLLKGGFAWCAGHLSIKKGKITFLSNNSGHYLPSLYHFYTVVKKLNSEELFEKDAELNAVENAHALITHKFSVDDFLKNYDESVLQENWKREINERIRNNTFLKALFTC